RAGFVDLVVERDQDRPDGPHFGDQPGLPPGAVKMGESDVEPADRMPPPRREIDVILLGPRFVTGVVGNHRTGPAEPRVAVGKRALAEAGQHEGAERAEPGIVVDVHHRLAEAVFLVEILYQVDLVYDVDEMARLR